MTSLTTADRIQAAQAIAEALDGLTISGSARVWAPDANKPAAPVRVYLPLKGGYISIDHAGRANTERVKRAAYDNGLLKRLEAAGITTYRSK